MKIQQLKVPMDLSDVTKKWINRERDKNITKSHNNKYKTTKFSALGQTYYEAYKCKDI